MAARWGDSPHIRHRIILNHLQQPLQFLIASVYYKDKNACPKLNDVDLTTKKSKDCKYNPQDFGYTAPCV